MKKLIGIFAFVILTSFVVNENTKKLPNGHYKAELDKKYIDIGLKNFDFNIENEKFTIKIADKYETLEIYWVDKSTFLVRGYTEPLNPTEAEKKRTENSKIYFRITNQIGNAYYFYLGENLDKHPVYEGKFVKTN